MPKKGRCRFDETLASKRREKEAKVGLHDRKEEIPKDTEDKIVNEEIKKIEEPLDNIITNGIEEIQINVTDNEPITLKKPNEVYYEIYKAARAKAKHMRRIAVEAYLEAKNIKTKYALNNIDDSEDSEDELSDDEHGLNL